MVNSWSGSRIGTNKANVSQVGPNRGTSIEYRVNVLQVCIIIVGYFICLYLLMAFGAIQLSIFLKITITTHMEPFPSISCLTQNSLKIGWSVRFMKICDYWSDLILHLYNFASNSQESHTLRMRNTWDTILTKFFPTNTPRLGSTKSQYIYFITCINSGTPAVCGQWKQFNLLNLFESWIEIMNQNTIVFNIVRIKVFRCYYSRKILKIIIQILYFLLGSLKFILNVMCKQKKI